MNEIELVGIVVGALATIVGGFFAAIRLANAPMQVVIENNTEAMRRVVDTLERHDEKLENHEVRIVKIETKHEVEAGQ